MDYNRTIEIGDKAVAAIFNRTNKEKPKREDVEALRQVFKEQPELWRQVADFARLAEQQIVSNLRAAVLIKEGYRAGLETMREELGYTSASALERLLIDQVTLTWLHYHNAQYRHEGVLSEGTSFRNAEWLEKRLNGAHRRYVRAMEALARVRKMQGRRPVQINIAQQQVNVG